MAHMSHVSYQAEGVLFEVKPKFFTLPWESRA